MASPISAQPLSTKNTDSSAQGTATMVEITSALTIKLN
jgi:hypothetical protein